MDLVLIVVAAVCAIAALVAYRRGHRAELERVRASRHREAERRHRLELELADARERQAAEAARPLVGRTVIANTPRPDDRSIRGVVARELENGYGGLVLQGAVYLDPSGDPSNPGVREVSAGELVVPRVSFAQIIYPSE